MHDDNATREEWVRTGGSVCEKVGFIILVAVFEISLLFTYR